MHRLIGELGARCVAADHEHQDRILVGVALGDVLEAADHARRERNDVERIEIDVFDLAVLVFPARTPSAGHRDEGLVGVVIVHHRAATRFGPAIAEIKSLADLDGREPCRVVANRRRHRAAFAFGRLKSDDVVERALATRHLAVGQSAVKPFEVFETGDALYHLGPGQCNPRQRFHEIPPCVSTIASTVACGRQLPNKSLLTMSRITSLVPSRIWCTRRSRKTRSIGWSRR